MTVLRAFVIIIVSGLVGGLLGGALGYTIGTLAPTLYAAQFPRGAAMPGFNSAHVGIALGLPQGLVAGVLIGCVVVLAVAIASRFRAPAVGDTLDTAAWDRASRPVSPGQRPSTDFTS